MHELIPNPSAAVDWEKLRPTLDLAIGELKDDDRDAVVLRFFEGKSFADVGAKLRLPENTARMRVERALDKLHALLARRGVTSTTAALAVALANQAGVAAPAGLAASVTGAALAGTAASGGGLMVTFMGISKLQMVIASALAVTGAAGYVWQAETNAGLRREIASLATPSQNAAALRVENQQLTNAAAEVAMLRRDDVELKQLEQRVADVKQANVEKARLAQARAQDQRTQFYDKIRADDARAQQEVDRINREGNVLVVEYKDLMTRTKGSALTPEARAEAEAAARAKLEAIKLKKEEIKVFVENTRSSLMQRLATYLSLNGDDPNIPPPTFQTGGGHLEVRRSTPSVDAANNPPPPSGKFYLGSGQARLDDEQGSLELTMVDGKKQVVAKNSKGEQIFTGPINTPEEWKALPEDVRIRLENSTPPK